MHKETHVPKADSLLVQHVGEPLDLVLLVVEQGLKCHDVRTHHVARGEATGVKDGPLGKDDAAAVRIALRQHKHVAHVNQLTQVGVLQNKSLAKNYSLKLHKLKCFFKNLLVYIWRENVIVQEMLHM